MADCNMVELLNSDEGRLEEVGVFTVAKKEGKQRLIVDARGSNLHFVDVDPVHLATGATFSRISLKHSETLWVSSVDIADAFYLMALPEQLRGYFAMAPVKCSKLPVGL